MLRGLLKFDLIFQVADLFYKLLALDRDVLRITLQQKCRCGTNSYRQIYCEWSNGSFYIFVAVSCNYYSRVVVMGLLFPINVGFDFINYSQKVTSILTLIKY
jgi:hypothetical protein